MPLTEGIFKYETEKDKFEKKSDSLCAVVTGTVQERRFIEVPETLGGLPVRRIAPHAFSGKAGLRVISFPESLRSVGAFAMHNCPLLEEISLHDGIQDFHNGVVRQDPRLRRIRLQIHEKDYTVMRDILSDTDARLRFCLKMPDGEARLLFPGYDYSFNENTMARTIQFSILGSGMFYRECVRRKGIGWREYDRLFPKVIPDDAYAAAEIAADRLLYPYDLAPVHAKAYEDYLRENAGKVLLQFTKDIAEDHTGSGEDEAYRRLNLMADRGLICGEAANPALKEASDRHMTEVCSIIMAGREAAFKDSSALFQIDATDAFTLPDEEESAAGASEAGFGDASNAEQAKHSEAGTESKKPADLNAEKAKHSAAGTGSKKPADSNAEKARHSAAGTGSKKPADSNAEKSKNSAADTGLKKPAAPDAEIFPAERNSLFGKSTGNYADAPNPTNSLPGSAALSLEDW